MKKFAPHLTRKHAIRTGVVFFALSAGLAIAAPWDAGTGAGHGPRGDMMAADANADGKITKAEMQAQIATRFAEMDANRDGTLNQADREISKKQKLDAHFGEMDTNRDGSISRAEFDASHAKENAAKSGEMARKGRRGGDGPKRGKMGAAMPDMTKSQFETMALARFDRVDANKDGTVDAAEMQAGMAKGRRGKGGRGGMGGGMGGSDAGPAGDDMSAISAVPAPANSPVVVAQ